jgi:hypothetical protein
MELVSEQHFLLNVNAEFCLLLEFIDLLLGEFET